MLPNVKELGMKMEKVLSRLILEIQEQQLIIVIYII